MLVNLTKDLEHNLETVTITTGNKGYQSMVDTSKILYTLIAVTNDNDIDMKLVQAQDDSGTGVKDITGAAITTLASGAGKVVQIEIDQQQLDGDNDFTHVAAVLTVAGTATGALLCQKAVNHRPATQPTEIVEQVLVVG